MAVNRHSTTETELCMTIFGHFAPGAPSMCAGLLWSAEAMVEHIPAQKVLQGPVPDDDVTSEDLFGSSM